MSTLPEPSVHATVIEGTAHNGRACRIVDNTGTVPRAELEQLLADLIAGKRFGLNALSATGSSAIKLGEPQFAHLQIGDDLYRFLLLSYEARLEAF